MRVKDTMGASTLITLLTRDDEDPIKLMGKIKLVEQPTLKHMPPAIWG